MCLTTYELTTQSQIFPDVGTPVIATAGWRTPPSVRLTSDRSFHSFDPLSPRWPRLERVAEVLRFVDYLSTLEFHNANNVKRLRVIGHDEFADPKIAGADHATHGKAFYVRLGDARRLNVGSASDAFARLRIVENCISSVDLVLGRKVVGVGGRPVAPQGDPHIVITHGFLSSQRMRQRPSFAGLRRTVRRERDHWDGPRRLSLVLTESRIPLGLQGILLVPFGGLQLGGMHVDDVVSDFDAGVGVGLEVPVPGWVLVATVVRGEHEVPVAVGEVHHDVGPRFPAACTDGVQEDQWCTLERATDATVVGAEFGDITFVEIASIAHRDFLTSTCAQYRSCNRPPDCRTLARQSASSAFNR